MKGSFSVAPVGGGRMLGRVCFSPLVDLAGGALVAAIGIYALRHLGRPAERLLASLPMVFGLHQIIEAIIGWGLDGRMAPAVWRVGLVAEGHRVVYQVHVQHRSLVVLLYLAATCGALLPSSQRYIRRFGVVNLAAAGALIWLDQTALISLWCAWAAITSLTITLHLRRGLLARNADADPGATPITVRV